MAKIDRKTVELFRSFRPTAGREDVLLQVRRRSQAGKALARKAGRVLRDPKLALDEDVRVGASRCLAYLLPDSLEQISDLLGHRKGLAAYEVHFSLFIWLDMIHYGIEVPSDCEERLLEQIKDYLWNVESYTACSAWMAGDLLGDHWPAETATPVLFECVEKARFAAGRHGALHGLAHLYRNVDQERKEVVARTVERVEASDRSKVVRRWAKKILDGDDVCAGGEPWPRQTG